MAEEHGQVKDEKLDPEAELRRRLALAQIRQYPDPALRLKAHEVGAFDDDLTQLVERMTKLMHDANGVGLAANQVGILRRVLVFQPGADAELRAVVNPRLVGRSDEVETDEEGCLSLQGVRVPVERPVGVRLEGRDPAGNELLLDLDGLGARVVQHELDHLDGVLIIDRTDDAHRKEALGILRPQPLLR